MNKLIIELKRPISEESLKIKLSKLSQRTTDDFDDNFILGNEIGNGTFAKVFIAKSKDGSGLYAAKVFDKNVNIGKFKKEITMLKRAYHKHIIRFYDFYSTDDNHIIITELATGGELFSRIVGSSLCERKTSIILYQLSSAVNYMHSLNLVHRDLKPENILCVPNGEELILKISDFGLATIMPKYLSTNSYCGTPEYAAPELLCHKKYNYKVDCWSLGVILYILLTSYVPYSFNGSINYLILQIEAQNVEFGDFILSEESKDIVKCLLTKDINERYDTFQILSHPFITNYSCLQ